MPIYLKVFNLRLAQADLALLNLESSHLFLVKPYSKQIKLKKKRLNVTNKIDPQVVSVCNWTEPSKILMYLNYFHAILNARQKPIAHCWLLPSFRGFEIHSNGHTYSQYKGWLQQSFPILIVPNESIFIIRCSSSFCHVNYSIYTLSRPGPELR